MPTRLLDTTTANVGGVATLGTTTIIQAYEWVTMENINDFIELGLALGGVVFLCYKISGQRLDNKIKRQKIKDHEVT